MKYKVGDKVRIKSIDWYNENKNPDYGFVYLGNGICFYSHMSNYCGKTMTISEIFGCCYRMAKCVYDNWTDEMIEGLVEEETKPEPKFKVGDSVEVLKTGNTYTISQVKFNGKEFVYTLSITDSSVCWFSEEELKPIRIINIAIKPHNVRGDEVIKMLEELGGTNVFSFDGSDHNCVNPFAYYIDKDKQIYGGGIEFLRRNGYEIHALEELKKKEYPKTFEECVHVLEGKNRMYLEQMNTFRKLIDARNAYWKIYGEENGLGKPWEPDWKNSEEKRYCIVNIEGVINLPEKVLTKWILKVTNKILVFPTAEMRDAFYENFKSEIESCKEFL